MHILSIWFPYASPILGWLLFRRDPFIARHCGFRLKREILELVLSAALIVANLGFSVFTAWQSGFKPSGEQLAFGLGRMALLWLIFSLWGLFHIVGCIRGALKAFRGVAV